MKNSNAPDGMKDSDIPRSRPQDEAWTLMIEAIEFSVDVGRLTPKEIQDWVETNT